jgi:hypothetical protein
MTLASPSYSYTSFTESTSSLTPDGMDSGTIVTIVFGITAAIMTAVNIWQKRHYFRNVRAAFNEQGQSPRPGLLSCEY